MDMLIVLSLWLIFSTNNIDGYNPTKVQNYHDFSIFSSLFFVGNGFSCTCGLFGSSSSILYLFDEYKIMLFGVCVVILRLFTAQPKHTHTVIINQFLMGWYSSPLALSLTPQHSCRKTQPQPCNLLLHLPPRVTDHSAISWTPEFSKGL